MYSTVQAIVPYEINGEKYFTHTSWFSERQYRAFHNIPVENNNLALYFGLSTVACAAIFLHRSSLLRPFKGSFFKVSTGFVGGTGLSYLAWLTAFRGQETSQITDLVSRNDNGAMPLWKSQESVVNLRDRDYKTFMRRRQHKQSYHKKSTFKTADIKSWKPDGVLVGSKGGLNVQQVA